MNNNDLKNPKPSFSGDKPHKINGSTYKDEDIKEMLKIISENKKIKDEYVDEKEKGAENERNC